MNEEIQEIVRALASRKPLSQEDRPFPIDAAEEVKSKLVQLEKQFSAQNKFTVGQFVTWKPGLKNKLKPRLNEPAIVVKLLDAPLYDQDQDSGSPYFMEPLDMVIGVLEEERHTLLLFHVDRRRFMPFD
jgi:hypothetical protein